MADALTILGLAAICAGVAFVFWPAALMVGGAAVMTLGVTAAERERRKQVET